MAVITPTIEHAGRESMRVIWANIGDADTCTAVQFPHARDKTVQVYGTFGGATIVLQGSLDEAIGGTYVGLTDPQGNEISFTADGIEAVAENTQWVKPATSGGTSSSVTVTMLMVVTV
jgi:hypothetical protein